MMKAMLFAAVLMASCIVGATAQTTGATGHRQPQAHPAPTASGPTAKAHPAQKRHMTRWQRRAECLRRYRESRPKFNLRKRKWPAFYAKCDARLRREAEARRDGMTPAPRKK
jgi:hypothetical protein